MCAPKIGAQGKELRRFESIRLNIADIPANYDHQPVTAQADGPQLQAPRGTQYTTDGQYRKRAGLIHNRGTQYTTDGQHNSSGDHTTSERHYTTEQLRTSGSVDLESSVLFSA